MKHILIIFLIATSAISFYVEQFEQCQCFLLMALLFYTIWDDFVKKKNKI